MFRYFVIYKPFGTLSQFSKDFPEQKTLADLGPFPKDIYPIGRLDKDSEGLLILSNDKKLNNRLLNPKFKHKRTYWVEVERIPNALAIQKLNEGIEIRVNKKLHNTLPANVRLLSEVPKLPERIPPVRFRQNIPTAWIELELIEGKNRQVRKMCAKVGFPTLRLVRVQIEDLTLMSLNPGQHIELNHEEIYKKLNLSS